jgi:O-antigen ligase
MIRTTKDREAISSYLSTLLVLCWLLSEVSFSLPGRSAALDVGGLDALAFTKLAIRLLSITVLGMIILRTHTFPRATVVLYRCAPLFLFAAWTVSTCLWSGIKSVSVGHALECVMLALLAIATGIVCRTERDLEITLCNVVLMASVLMLAMLVMNADLIAAGLRPAKYMQPNNMGGIAACGLITVLASRQLWGWRWTHKLLWPAGLICGAAIIAAHSRSVLIVTSFAVLPLMWSLGRRNFPIVVIAVMGLLAAGWPYWQAVSDLPQSVENYLMRGQTVGDAYTVSGRTEVWDIAIQSFLESPLFGHGYYSMTSTGTMYVWGAQRWQTAHNIYLHVLTGTGLMGFCLLAWALCFVLGPLARHLAAGTRVRKVARFVFLLVAWYLALGFFELSFGGPIDPEVVLFFLILGIAAGQIATEQTRGARS